MAEMTIMLRRDPNTGKQNIIIKLDSDPDALPLEHENMHKALAEKLIGKKLEDFGEIIVEREGEAQDALGKATVSNDSAQEPRVRCAGCRLIVPTSSRGPGNCRVQEPRGCDAERSVQPGPVIDLARPGCPSRLRRAWTRPARPSRLAHRIPRRLTSRIWNLRQCH